MTDDEVVDDNAADNNAVDDTGIDENNNGRRHGIPENWETAFGIWVTESAMQ